MSATAELDRLTWAFLDGTIGDDDALELRLLLLESENMRRFVRLLDMQASLTGLTVRDEAIAVGSDRGLRLRRAGGGGDEDRVRAEWTHRRQWALPAAAAAAVLVAVGAWVWNAERGMRNAERGMVVARVVEVGGQSQISNPKSQAVNMGDEVRVGDRIETGEKGSVKFAYIGEKTEIELGERSTLNIQHSTFKAGKALYLRSGSLAANVAHQEVGNPFVLKTPQTKVEVKGTRFSLRVSDGTGDRSSPTVHTLPFTRLEVSEGLVAFTRLSDGRTVEVSAGHGVTAAAGGTLLAVEALVNTADRKSPGALLLLDFEDRLLPPRTGGVITEGPRRNNSKYCVAGTHDKQDRLFRVNIRNGDQALFTYREGAVLSFDYWVKEYTGALDVYFWNETKKVSRGFVVRDPAQEQWTHVTKRLSDFAEEIRGGDLIWDLTVQTTPGGNELFVDNIRIETEDKP